MVAGLADFLLSGVQQPTAGYSPVHEHLTAGITHPVKVNPSRGSNSASRSSGHSGRRVRTSVSQACGSRPLRFAVYRRLIICAARFPAISEPANSHAFRPITTGRMARSQILLSRGTAPSPRKQLSSSRRFRI
ncbi:hypothetical protein FORC11_p0153 (plasmid) [Shigella sonnei]|nr:hypothetical protein FORC11_p0153 [Shigella sonnei]